MEEKQNKYAAQMRYDAKNVVRVTINFNKKTDEDIISAFDMEKPLSTQIKEFIRNGLEQKG